MFLKPDFNLESIYDINFEKLKQMGIKALFFDLDSTLMKSKSGVFSSKTLNYLEKLKSDFSIAIISNNKNLNYIERAKSQTDVKIYSCAAKPSPKTIFKACQEFNIKPIECAMIGDRPLSDIWAGKKAGTVTILVDSISKDEETPIVRFARYIERLSIKK